MDLEDELARAPRAAAAVAASDPSGFAPSDEKSAPAAFLPVFGYCVEASASGSIILSLYVMLDADAETAARFPDIQQYAFRVARYDLMDAPSRLQCLAAFHNIRDLFASVSTVDVPESLLDSVITIIDYPGITSKRRNDGKDHSDRNSKRARSNPGSHIYGDDDDVGPAGGGTGGPRGRQGAAKGPTPAQCSQALRDHGYKPEHGLVFASSSDDGTKEPRSWVVKCSDQRGSGPDHGNDRPPSVVGKVLWHPRRTANELGFWQECLKRHPELMGQIVVPLIEHFPVLPVGHAFVTGFCVPLHFAKPSSPIAVQRLVERLFSALSVLHTKLGFVHGDIRRPNVLLEPAAYKLGFLVPLLVDFDLCTRLSDVRTSEERAQLIEGDVHGACDLLAEQDTKDVPSPFTCPGMDLQRTRELAEHIRSTCTTAAAAVDATVAWFEERDRNRIFSIASPSSDSGADV